ncbi:non-neuronal cytoplasmic intermediate filament protein-like [Mercenaria mercenaria]|uniref:non-neuronal cytoplasmic intermediate filament protein-like n=1 Tax=Mercenaria mercenaria TaxID=6596 RepID=UPI00234E4CCE|nr:non-neuronal cytoplasmic intermediate filament protein-like [Mercenaria mercenaria]XP_045171433.2 non-neuronal cytoplasmic intermediate filament protein-like [Mercenaria mercenaria]
MTTTMDVDRKFDMGRWGSSQSSFSGSNSISSVYSRHVNVSRSFSSPNKIKYTGAEAEKVMSSMMSSVDKERKDLDELNAKLAGYIVTVRSKEATNKHLIEEIERLKEAFLQTQTRIREEYSIEIEETKSKIGQLSDGLAPLKAKLISLERTLEMKDTEITVLQKRIDELQLSSQKKDRAIGELEGECTVLRNQIKEIRQDNKRIRMDNDRIRGEQEVALTRQIKAQNECENLAEERKYLEITLHAEIRELRGLLSAFEFVQPNLEEAHKAEFTECIKAIQAEYNGQLAKLREEQQGSYEIQGKRLEAEMAEMRMRYEEESSYFDRERAELQQRISEQETELRSLMSRLSSVRTDNLDLEISTYRKLLDGKTEMQGGFGKEKEEKVAIVGQKKMEASGISSSSSSSSSSSTVQSSGSSFSQVVSSQSSESVLSSSPLTIKEVESTGSFIMFYNSSKSQEVDLSNWTIERTHPKGTATFKIPQGNKIGPEKEIKILSKGAADKKGPGDIVATCKTWASGNGQVKVTDDKGVEVIVYKYSLG